jgi:hypothetical protein
MPEGGEPWVVYGHSSSHICGGAMRWSYRKSRDRKLPWPEVIACATVSRVFSYYSSSTSTMATGSDPCGVPLGVRMRNRKLHNILPREAFWPEVTLWNVIRSDRDPFGALYDVSVYHCLALVICPFPAILLAPSIITQKFVVFEYVRGCCVVLLGCPRSHCGISKSQMNEMVNHIPTCIVSNKNLFQDDSSQFWKTMYSREANVSFCTSSHQAKNIYARVDNNNPPGVAHKRNRYWRWFTMTITE